MDPRRFTEAEAALTVEDFAGPFVEPDLKQWAGATANRRQPCRVYWGSHGCKLERGHHGPHLCDCADDEGVDPVTREYIEDRQIINVGAPPYYGPETTFYGEDTTLQERGEPGPAA